jgi:hypothetical protein
MTYTIEKSASLLKPERDCVALEKISQSNLYQKLDQLKSLLFLCSKTSKDCLEIVPDCLDAPAIFALTSSLDLATQLADDVQSRFDTEIDMPIWKILNSKIDSSVEKNDQDEFLLYFREHYPKLKELLIKVKEKETEFSSPFVDNDDLFAQKLDEFWQPISENELKEIFNLMNCL